MCLLAFAIAVTVGAMWEIFEFLMDLWFGLNMQKSGLTDTMGDLIVDVIGAGIASWIGYAYLRGKDRSFWAWPVAVWHEPCCISMRMGGGRRFCSPSFSTPHTPRCQQPHRGSALMKR